MAYQKLQVSRGLGVVTSDTVNIPNPAAVAAASTTDGAGAGKLIDSTVDFTALNIRVGDIVYTAAIAATVTAIDSATQLSVSTAIPTLTAYTIYSQSTNPSNGCVLYVGVAGDVRVLTADGDDITLKTVGAGSFLPVQTLKVFATDTTATDIIALW